MTAQIANAQKIKIKYFLPVIQLPKNKQLPKLQLVKKTD
jgi:hypothetical protein